MSEEEIKKILDSITDNIEDYYVGANGCLYQDLTKEELLYIKNYITKLQQKNSQLKEIIENAIKITNKILMNNADNRMICKEEEQEYFDWLDSEMLKQEKILKGDKI